MTNTIQSYTNRFISKLFELGLETYDRETGNRGNIGGAKSWFHKGGFNKPEQSGITLYDQNKRNIFSHVGAKVFTFSRSRVDEEGKEVTNDEGYPIKDFSCFTLYASLDNSSTAADILQNHILDNFPELEGYVCRFIDYTEELVKLGIAEIDITGEFAMPSIPIRTPFGQHGARLHSMILFALPSGEEDSGAIWGYCQKELKEAY